MIEHEPKSKGKQDETVEKNQPYVPKDELEAESLREAYLDTRPGGYDWNLRLDMMEEQMLDRKTG